MKMSKKNPQKFIIIFVLLCNLSYGQYDELKNCINKKYEIYNKLKGLNLFDSIKKHEAFLMESKLLKNKSKKSYCDLIKKEFSFDDLGLIVNQVKNKEFFYYNFNDYSYNMIMMYNACPYEVARVSKEMSDKFYPVVQIYNKVIAKSYPTSEILQELWSNTNYDNEISRLMLCNLVYCKWISDYKAELVKVNGTELN